MNFSSFDNYADIFDLPHPVSRSHPQMSMYDRAAQFSPFAALTGFDSQIDETARLVSSRITLSEDRLEELDLEIERLRALILAGTIPSAVIEHFIPDPNVSKNGGAYVRTAVSVRSIDSTRQLLVTTDGKEFYFDDIISIESR